MENPIIPEDNKVNTEPIKNLVSIKYTSQISKELLESQIETYRSLNNKAGVILNILALFIPVYLFIIDHSNIIIKGLSIIVILLLIFGIVAMFIVLNTYTLHIGVKEDKYEEFINMSEIDIYLFEIAANKESIEINDKDVLEKQYLWYELGTKSVIISVISATILLTFSIFNKTENQSVQNKDNDSKIKIELIVPTLNKIEVNSLKK